MPVRLVREGILTSDRVNALDCGAEVFYRRLLNVVDDYGLYDGRLAILRCALYPLRLETVTEADIAGWLERCEAVGLLVRYQVGGRQFIKVFNTRWQHRSNAKYPLPPEIEQPELLITNSSDNSCEQMLTTAHLDVVVVVEKLSDTSLRSVSAGDPELIKEEVWRIGKLMFEKQGVGPKMSGSYLGMLIKHHGEEQVLAALRQGIEHQPADLKSWLRGVLKPKPATRTAVRLKAGDTIYGEQTHEQQSDKAPAERDITAESNRLA